MAETSIIKVNARSSPKGSMGQKYMAAGVGMAMRFWGRTTGPRETGNRSATMKPSVMSSKDVPSCIWDHKLCC